jgi:hypothetical protein
MITVNASQKIFTYTEVMNLTGICFGHLHNLATRHRLGFMATAAPRALEIQPIIGFSRVGT